MKRSWIIIGIILLVLILDQTLKIYIKTNFALREGFDILGLDWAKIFFVENRGMAFGMELPGGNGKLILSLFRIVMISFLGYLLWVMMKAKESMSLLIGFSLILAGAIGNMIDSAFYGLIFSESPYHSGLAAEFMPEGGGYAAFLHGKVVDMFYFPLIDTHWPEWVPRFGGDRFQFFRPVFNLADAAITSGVISILLFNRAFFLGPSKKNTSSDAEGRTSNLSNSSEEE